MFLYINKELSKKEIKKAILFIIASKRIKHSEINNTHSDLTSDRFFSCCKSLTYLFCKYLLVEEYLLVENSFLDPLRYKSF